MKVAFVSFAFGEYSIRLATALAEHVEVGLWLPHQQADPHLHSLGSAVHYFPFDKPRMRQGHRQLPLMRNLIRRIIEFEPDVVHLQQGFLWLNPFLSNLADFPLVLTVHDPVPHLGDRLGKKTPKFVTRIGHRKATSLVVHNSEVRDVMVELGAEPDRLNVVPLVVRGHDHVTVDVDEEEGLVLFFGRIWPYKGLDYLIRAEPLISARFPRTRIVVAGRGEDFRRYERLMTNSDRFEVHNEYISDRRVAELFRRASVVALPYVDASQSGVIVTAYNFSKPVVATTVGGLPSMVDHGTTGFLVPPRDEVALADAIVTLLQDSSLRTRMGQAGKHRASIEFSPSSIAKKTIDVYTQAIMRQTSLKG